MNVWPSVRAAPPAERLLRLILYFDIFYHPLTSSELAALAFEHKVEGDEVVYLLDPWLKTGELETLEGYLFPRGRSAGVGKRQEKARHSQTLWKKVPTSGAILSSFPFIRGLAVTGTLAKEAALPDSDVDFLVFTAQGRVWLCRTMLAVTRRVLPHHQRETLCTNVFLDETHLTYDQQNPYVAAEIGLSRPVYSPELVESFLRANPWVRDFLPGMIQLNAAPATSSGSVAPGLTRRMEQLLSGRLGDWAEAALPHLWATFWALKHRELPSRDRQLRFRVTPHVSTNHLNNFQVKVLNAYRERLHTFNLSTDEG